MERAGEPIELGGGVGGLAQRGDRYARLREVRVERHGEDDLALPGHGGGVGDRARGVQAGVDRVLGLVDVHRGTLGVAEEVGVEVGHGVVGGVLGQSSRFVCVVLDLGRSRLRIGSANISHYCDSSEFIGLEYKTALLGRKQGELMGAYFIPNSIYRNDARVPNFQFDLR